jgi:hypothetical protein
LQDPSLSEQIRKLGGYYRAAEGGVLPKILSENEIASGEISSARQILDFARR